MKLSISQLQDNSYAPYSDGSYTQIAWVQSRQGAWFTGVRVENISFPLTISAVQNALFCCLSEGQEPTAIFFNQTEQERPSLSYWVAEFDLKIASTLPDEVPLHSVTQPLSEQQIEPKLNELLDNTVSGYSNFPVAALLETSSGFIAGVNIEVSDWNQGLCAERIAVAKALTYGANNFKALHICTRDGEYNTPCGACRQVIVEHLPHHPVYLYHADGTTACHFSSDLLPYSFQSSALQKNSKKKKKI